MDDSEVNISNSTAGEPDKRRFVLSRRASLIIVSFGLIVFGALGYFWHKQQSARNKPKTPAVELYSKIDYTKEDNQRPSLEEQIKLQEEKMAKQPATYEDYLALAQLYSMSKNYTKAIENYEKAKQAADPKAENYASTIDFLDKVIKLLKEKQ